MSLSTHSVSLNAQLCPLFKRKTPHNRGKNLTLWEIVGNWVKKTSWRCSSCQWLGQWTDSLFFFSRVYLSLIPTLLFHCSIPDYIHQKSMIQFHVFNTQKLIKLRQDESNFRTQHNIWHDKTTHHLVLPYYTNLI